MPDKEKKPEFVVTDRRLFSTDGELRQDVVEAEERREEREQETREAQQRLNAELAAQRDSSTVTASAPSPSTPEPEPEAAVDDEAPTAAEQQASANAYQQSTREVDDQIRKELGKQGQAHRAKDFEMSFEKFLSSLYMTAMLQLGLAAPQGDKPQVDLIGARQTIDVIGILQEKTKGNLTVPEENILQNILYELRMAYLEVTNLITRPPQPGAPGGPQR
jgi:hypothetical protein